MKANNVIIILLVLLAYQSLYPEMKGNPPVAPTANRETIYIGSGSTLHQGLPIEPVARYSCSQQIFMAAEIGVGGAMQTIGFHYNVNSTLFYAGNRMLKVWLGHTTQTTQATWITADNLTLVYDGMLSESDFTAGLPGNGWLLITLPQPFTYNGTDNLVLTVDENSYEYGSTSDDFLCTDTGLPLSLQFQSQTVNPDPYNPPAALNVKTYRSNLRIEIEAQHYFPVQPSPADGATGVAIDTDFRWNSQCDSYILRLGTHPDSLQVVAQGLTQCLWQITEPMQYNRQYYWQVTGVYAMEFYPSPVWSFTTATQAISPPQNLSANYNGEAVQLVWQSPATGQVHYYRIYRNNALLTTTMDAHYSDAAVLAGLTYYYYLTAVNPSGSESGASNLASITIPDAPPGAIISQGFEDCEAFSLLVPGWQLLDLDLSLTWGWDGISYPHEGEAMAWQCFAPSQTTPPLTGFPPYSGSKMLMAMSSLTPPNNDWLISPAIHIGSTGTLSFKARSAVSDYGLERLKVLVSTTDASPASFTPFSPGAYLQVPVAWTDYSYDLATYHDQRIYLAWQCVSVDAFALFLDSLELTSTGGWVSVDDALVPAASFRCYPNPTAGNFEVHAKNRTPFALELYDLRGRLLYAASELSSFHSDQLGYQLPSGIYFVRIAQHGTSQIHKQVIVK